MSSGNIGIIVYKVACTLYQVLANYQQCPSVRTLSNIPTVNPLQTPVPKRSCAASPKRHQSYIAQMRNNSTRRRVSSQISHNIKHKNTARPNINHTWTHNRNIVTQAPCIIYQDKFSRATSRQCQDLHLDQYVPASVDCCGFGGRMMMVTCASRARPPVSDRGPS
jgi:hypothetical protein